MQAASAPAFSPFQSRTISGTVSARITIDGRTYINFFGSGYLALAEVPEVRGAVLKAVQGGAAFARQVPSAMGARDPEFDAVERVAAAALAAESSVYLPSGYLIGMALLGNLSADIDHVLIDEGAHYSLKDAARLSGLPTFPFAHCDAQSLADVLARESRGRRRPLVVTDGVYATTGRVPPLKDYAACLEPRDGRILVDESHAFGVVGVSGRGAAEHCGVEQLTLAGATLSKALCAQGAVVACSAQAAKDMQSMPLIRGACAGSPLSAVAAAASLNYCAEHPELRKKLRETAEYLRTRLRSAGLSVLDTPAAIVSFQFGKRADMLDLQRRAWEQGICLYHSTYLGAGPEGMIRCGVFRNHSPADIDALMDVLERA